MKDPVHGTIKFVHPNGYGFVTTDDGDVFFHIKGFCQPTLEKLDNGPIIGFPYAEIDPKNIEKDARVTMVVEEGPKGKSAKSWCFMEDTLAANLVLENMSIYRLMSREVITGQPYGDPDNRCWKYDQHLLLDDWVWQGYDYQLKDFRRRPGVQYQIYKGVDGWVECQCPLGQYNGGSLFDLPLDWKQSMRCK